MPQVVPINMEVPSVTPVFKYLDLEDVPKSEQAGYEVRRMLEVVEVHTAGSRNSAPVFPVDAQWKREGNRTITYAERWPNQYREFKDGGPQNAIGTPLEMLRPQGITPELISVCRVNKIYSIEALHTLSHDGIRGLGVHANKLRDAARMFMADRVSGIEAQTELAELRARIAAMEAERVAVLDNSLNSSREVNAEIKRRRAVIGADVIGDESTFIASMGDEEIKVAIKEITGSRPAGNPSRATLEAALRELRQVA